MKDTEILSGQPIFGLSFEPNKYIMNSVYCCLVDSLDLRSYYKNFV